MKTLIYPLIVLITFACNNSQKLVTIIQDIDKNLATLEKIQTEDLTSKLINLEEIVTKYRYPDKAQLALKKVKMVYQKYQKVLKALDNQRSNQECFKVYQEYREWLRKKAKQWNFDIEKRSYYQSPENVKFQTLLNISKDLKPQIQSRIYKETERILNYLGANDLSTGIVDYFSYAYVIASNSSRFAEKGEEIELSQYIFMPHIRSDSLKNLELNANIDKGVLKKVRNVFEITIPTQELGKQQYKASIHVQNRALTLDTTFHLSKTFEVIK